MFFSQTVRRDDDDDCQLNGWRQDPAQRRNPGSDYLLCLLTVRLPRKRDAHAEENHKKEAGEVARYSSANRRRVAHELIVFRFEER